MRTANAGTAFGAAFCAGADFSGMVLGTFDRDGATSCALAIFVSSGGHNRVFAVERLAPSQNNDSHALFIENSGTHLHALKPFRPAELIKSDSAIIRCAWRLKRFTFQLARVGIGPFDPRCEACRASIEARSLKLSLGRKSIAVAWNSHRS
jgi:hypothetical protein